jgi:hypothetical protein
MQSGRQESSSFLLGLWQRRLSPLPRAAQKIQGFLARRPTQDPHAAGDGAERQLAPLPPLLATVTLAAMRRWLLIAVPLAAVLSVLVVALWLSSASDHRITKENFDRIQPGADKGVRMSGSFLQKGS